LRAFSGAWAAFQFEGAAHAPEKAHARPGASGRRAARATRVRGGACACGVAVLILAAAPATQAKTAKSAKAALGEKAPGEKAPTEKAPTEKAPADIEALLAGLSKAPGLYAHFREEKHITLLQQPLVSEGSLYFAPPSRFARHTDKPIASTLIIDGNQLQFGSADGQESMNLGTNPVARLFADAFVMLLSGNRPGLEKIFKMQLTPKAGATGGASGEWKLVLTPRVAPMDKLIKELELRGRGLNLHELDVREASGDWTRTAFSDVDLNRRYTPAEQTKFFTLPKKK